MAAVQIKQIEAETGAAIKWRAVYSPDVIRLAGNDPFANNVVRGQYDSGYRTRDVRRWANLLGIPYVEPAFAAIDWRQIAVWAAAAELLGAGAAFGAAVLQSAFGKGLPPCSDGDLSDTAREAGLAADCIRDLIEEGLAEKRYEQNQKAVLAAGGFGVPTFVVDDEEVFWGQDRVPLLIDHLLTRKPSQA